MRIVLDPGHGGKDSGAVGRKIGIKEKDVVLGIAQQLAEKLKAAGHEVYLTRNSDVFITLPDRVKKFELWQADFVLSLHINSVDNNSSAAYLSAYLADLNDNKVVEKAKNLVSSCNRSLNWPNGGVKQANYYILRNTKRPICLIELGFITNPEQESMLARADFRAKIAGILYKVLNGDTVNPPQNTDKAEIIFEDKVIAEAKLIEGVAYAPVRKIAEVLGFNVIWEEQKGSIIINKL